MRQPVRKFGRVYGFGDVMGWIRDGCAADDPAMDKAQMRDRMELRSGDRGCIPIYRLYLYIG